MKKTLLLTSSGISEEIKESFIPLLFKKPTQTSVCFIPTAADPEKNKWFVEKAKNQIRDLGMHVQEVDLKKETEQNLFQKLSQCDVIFVNGGNTFYLLDWVRKSGFDKMLPDLLDTGKIYVGVSAGSYIACPTIDMAGWKDQDKNFIGLKDLTALNLVPFLLFAHYEEKYRQLVEDQAKNTSYPLITLTDTQAVLVKNKKYEIVGKGKKLIFNSKHDTT